jgi:phosphotransferase system enzyme I (PtsI)
VQRLNGIGVSAGVAIGRAVLLIQRAHAIQFHVRADGVERELARLSAAQAQSRRQLLDIKERTARSSAAEIGAVFDAQLLMLADPMLMARAADLIRERHVNAEWALQNAFDSVSETFERVQDPYLRERRADVADVVGRMRMNLRRSTPGPRELFKDLAEPYVLIADELAASVAAQVDWSKIHGFATDAGSRTYHTAILARSLAVPAVVGLGDASARVAPGATVVIDGAAGEIVIDPSPEILRELQRTVTRRPAAATANPEGRVLSAETADGTRIRLEANIELTDDLIHARQHGAEGIGLYRSEFLLGGAGPESVSEQAQFDVYRDMLERMNPHPVTIRTFDIEEDELGLRGGTREERGRWFGPAGPPHGRLRLRGVPLSLTRPESFGVQLRALVRASRHGQLRILFPFVSSVEEVRDARDALREATTEVTTRGESVGEIRVGVMMEVPAAGVIADLLAREVDFFTIGTNDLVQYCLAVDRAEARGSKHNDALHPAIIRLIWRIRRAAARRGIPVGLCGEMASDPVLLALLVGLGLTEFSMTPGAIPAARRVLRDLRADELRRLARRVLRLATVEEVEQEVLNALGGAARREATAVRKG